MKLSNKTYDVLKWVALVGLPALGTLCFTIASVWGLPYGEEIMGTIVAIETFIGTVLQISNAKYKKASVIEVVEEPAE